jgi:hypothetical protein
MRDKQMYCPDMKEDYPIIWGRKWGNKKQVLFMGDDMGDSL